MTSPVNAWSDANDLRWYTFQERDYLSVTSLRRVLGMSYNLHRWVLKQTLEVVQRDPSLLERGVRGNKPETDANIRGRIMDLGMADRNKSAERGTDVHAAISDGTPIKDLDPSLVPFVHAYSNAVVSLGIKPILTERQVFNDTFGYAGSFDLLADVRATQKRTVVDLKTGKGTYNDHALQGMAYLNGEFIGENDKKDAVATAHLADANGVAILHLHPGIGVGWTYHDIPVTPRLTQAFKAQAVLAKWMVDFPTIESLEV